MRRNQLSRSGQLLLLLFVLSYVLPAVVTQAAVPLAPLIFVARAHLATQDEVFRNELGPPGQLTTGLTKFAPGSKLMQRDSDGTLRILIDTARSPGDALNPLGLADLSSPDVSFDGQRIVFSATRGPYLPGNRAGAQARFSWRLYELKSNTLRQLTFDDRTITIPDGPGNAEAFGFYDDILPAFLADGRIVFSSSRYPSHAYYDARASFNLYLMNADGSGMQRITSERGAALHPTPLPDGRILFSRWWINFNQPSELSIFSRIDNGSGTEPIRNANGEIVSVERSIQVQERVAPSKQPEAAAPQAEPAPATATPTPWRPSSVERLDPATGSVYRVTVTPMPVEEAPAALQPTVQPRPPTSAAPAQIQSRTITAKVPLTGYRLPDGTLLYSNLQNSFRPARARLPDGTLVGEAPNTWHLMSIMPDGTDMRRYAWTPRYASELSSTDGNDTFNAVQPALLFVNGRMLVAYTTQRDGTMAHTSQLTGVRVAAPGIANMSNNTTESIAGMRWTGPSDDGNYALSPAGLPDGRLLLSQSVADPNAPQRASYRFSQNGRSFSLPLQGAAMRYELSVMQPNGSQAERIDMEPLPGFDMLDATALSVRQIGAGLSQWRLPPQTPCSQYCPIASDNPLEWDIPRGLLTTEGQPAYTWSQRNIESVKLTILHNANVYANPPLTMPYLNNSPEPGTVAFADIYIDAPQFTGATYKADQPDDQVRAVKWLTVPVSADGSFTASAPADTATFIVLRDQQGRVVRGGNRGMIRIAQGNSPGRAGEVTRCVGCHLGHASGAFDADTLASLGWTNVAPAAEVIVSSGNSNSARLIDRRGYVLSPTGNDYQDRTEPWIANSPQEQQIQLDWNLALAMLRVHLVGVEQAGFSSNYRIGGELRFYLNGQELTEARHAVAQVEPLSRGGTYITLERPLAADRIIFIANVISGTRNGSKAPVALSEIEVIGQGATPQALSSQPSQVLLPFVAP